MLLVPITQAVKEKPGRWGLSQALGRIIPQSTCRCQWVDGAPRAPAGLEQPGPALPSLMFDLGNKTVCWGTVILAVKWLAMASFQDTGKVKALYLQHGAPTDKLY